MPKLMLSEEVVPSVLLKTHWPTWVIEYCQTSEGQELPSSHMTRDGQLTVTVISEPDLLVHHCHTNLSHGLLGGLNEIIDGKRLA